LNINVRRAAVQSGNDKATIVAYSFFGNESDELIEILGRVVPEWAAELGDIDNKYGLTGVFELGERAEFADLYRAVAMLKRRYWDVNGIPEEDIDGLLREVVSSAFSLLLLRSRSQPGYEKMPWLQPTKSADDQENEEAAKYPRAVAVDLDAGILFLS